MSRWATRPCASRASIVIVQAPATVRRAVTRMAVAEQHRAARQVTPTEPRGVPDQRRTSVVVCRT
ncbi:MAG: hypothetical protein ACOYL4_10800, partial [Miltoncostaeaceae bacterium]